MKFLFSRRLVIVSLAIPLWVLGQEHSPVAGGVPETPAKKLYEELSQGKKVLVIDVRSPKEYSEGHVPGATNIPLNELSKKISEMKLAKDVRLVAVCEHGGRSSRAVEELQKLGYNASSFCKLDSWRKAGYRIEKDVREPGATGKVHKFTCHHYCQSDKETADLEEHCECACTKPYRDCMKGD